MNTEPSYNPSVGLPPVEEAKQPELQRSPKEIALRVVQADIETGRRANDAEKSKREEAYNLYRAMGDNKHDRPGRSRVKSSDVMDMVEWLMPSLMRAFFGSQNAISVEPIGAEDIVKAEMLQKLLNWQFVNKGNGFSVGHEWMKSSLVYGKSTMKVIWADEYKREGFAYPELVEEKFNALREDDDVESLTAESVRTEYKEVHDTMSVQTEEDTLIGTIANSQNFELQPAKLEEYRVYENVRGIRRIKSYSGPRYEVIPPEDFFCDPDCRDLRDARFAIHRVKRTVTYLKQKEKEGIYSNVQKAIENGSNNSSRAYRTEDDSERASRANDGENYSYYTTSSDVQKARQKLDVWEWWGLLDPDETGIAIPYIVVVCNGVVIRMEKNPYAHGEPPFEVMRPILDLFTMNGIGMVDLVGEYQKVKTAIIRQMLDNMSFQNNQVMAVDRNAGFSLNDLAHPRPGQILVTDNINGIKQITPAPLENNVYNMLEFIQGQLEQRTGITRYNQGLDSNTLNKTASGINAIMNASTQRIELIARVMAETGFRRLYVKMLSLDQQFIDQNIVIRVYNQPLQISPDDLVGNFDVTVDVGGATSKEDAEANQMLSLLNYSQLLSTVGVVRPQNIYQIMKKCLTAWGIAEYDKYIANPQEAQQLAQIVQAIDQFVGIQQQGMQVDPNMLGQQLAQIRQMLVGIIGNDVSKENPQAGVAPAGQQELESNSHAGNMIAYASGTLAGGPGGE